MNKTNKKMANQQQPSQYRVVVTFRFVTLSLLSCILLAFAVGRTARILSLSALQKQINVHNDLVQEISESSSTSSSSKSDGQQHIARLPNPVVQDGKTIPQTKYVSRNFNTAGSATIISRFLTTDDNAKTTPHEEQQCEEKEASGDDNLQASEVSAPASSGDVEEEEEEEVHLPAGQHLILDIKNVDSAFLSSEERLAGAMLEIVYECGLTLLSYHCHGLQPTGVSCVGVLLESHVSFHTWPERGVITLDLFTCGPNSLLPIFSNFKRLFSVPSLALDQSIPANRPQSIWSYKLRGFSSNDPGTKSSRTDFFTFPIGAMTEYKEEIASIWVGGVRVDIYDVLRPQFQNLELYLDSLVYDGSYESRHPYTVEPDRLVFINGILQSRRSGDASYHESLVHPTMFSHSNPRRVAIVGGGDGAVLREVLKHKTVQNVVVIEESQTFIDLFLQHLPEYSDCSSFLKGIDSCFDDPRVLLVNEDPSKWLQEKQQQATSSDESSFDIVLIDEDVHLEDSQLLKSVFGSLSSDGILAAPVGEAPAIRDANLESSDKYELVERLLNAGFHSVKDYEEGNSGFEWPWEAVVAFKTAESRTNWIQNEAMISLAIRGRTTPGGDGAPAVKYYDGAKHQSFQYPSKASETTFCRGSPRPKACDDLRDLDPDKRIRDSVIVDPKRRASLKQLGEGNRIAEVVEKYMDHVGSMGEGSGSSATVGYDPVVDRTP